MSPLLFIVAVIGGCVSATTIRDYTGGNSVEDILEHQDSQHGGSNEIPTLPEDNIDVEMMNTTNVNFPDMQCMEYYSCIMDVDQPIPPGSIKKGFYITTRFIKKICRNTKRVLSCYVYGDYADCPSAKETYTTGLTLYSHMCVEPGRSDVLSFLPCANNYDVQLSVYTSYLKLESAFDTIMNMTNAEPADNGYMMCWAMDEFRTKTGSVIETECSVHDREIFDRLVDIQSQPFERQFNCTLHGNDYGH